MAPSSAATTAKVRMYRRFPRLKEPSMFSMAQDLGGLRAAGNWSSLLFLCFPQLSPHHPSSGSLLSSLFPPWGMHRGCSHTFWLPSGGLTGGTSPLVPSGVWLYDLGPLRCEFCVFLLGRSFQSQSLCCLLLFPHPRDQQWMVAAPAAWILDGV